MKYTVTFDYLSQHWKNLCSKIKSTPCKHCKKQGYINAHGKLLGIAISLPLPATRGLRFFCSNRYSNKGCGRTFSILFASMLPKQSLRTRHLEAFFNNLLKHNNVHAAWHHSSIPFSITSAYRWFARFKANLHLIRAQLKVDAKPYLNDTSPPEILTIKLLKNSCPSATSSDHYLENFHYDQHTPTIGTFHTQQAIIPSNTI